jgi:ketol-acid reductoisomerase
MQIIDVKQMQINIIGYGSQTKGRMLTGGIGKRKET